MKLEPDPQPPRRARSTVLLILACASVPATLFAVSSFDNIEAWNPYGASNSFYYNYGAGAFGNGNSFYSAVENTLAIGTNNTFAMTADNSLAVGNANQLTPPNSLAVGQNNYVSGGGSAALGQGLIVQGGHSLAVGEYNDPDPNHAFAVGVGTSGLGNDKNAFVVEKDGSVLLPEPQGNISMGIFD